MANFIHTLQARVAEEQDKVAGLEAEIKVMQDRMNELGQHLMSAKFQGCESDGTLRSTIQVGDIHRWMDYIRGFGH
jgi:hypothetical protein